MQITLEKEKKCSRCKKTLPVSNFHKDKHNKDGFYLFCKECRKFYSLNYWNTMKYDAEFRRESIKRCKKYDDNIKLDVFKHYSNGKIECAICKCDDYRVLNIDHIGGGGLKERRKQNLDGGAVFFRWLIKNNYPEGYRVLCRNCNWLEQGVANWRLF